MTQQGCPYTQHSPADVDAMLTAIGVDSIEDLFELPESVVFDDEFGIEPKSEAATRRHVASTLAENTDLVEFYGRGHYAHYVPAVVEHLSDRSEFLTSYTQYQPEVAQGFLQALFEYQSIIRELTGLEVVNSSMYDHASALGEAALLSARVQGGERILVPDTLLAGRRAVLENYVLGAGLTVETVATDDGCLDVEGLGASIAEDVAMVYVESPTTRGTIEERLGTIANIAGEHDATCCLGSDPVALAALEEPAAAGVDVVVGDAGVLGLPTSYGMGLGMLAAREEFLRQVPGRLVGASEDSEGRRAYTLTLQTREQHIRKERATSNICTNQAWAALRTAMHTSWLGPDGLLELANDCVRHARTAAERIDAVPGVDAPVHDRHHFREFVASVAGAGLDAPAIVERLQERGFGVHAVDAEEIQVCVTDRNRDAVDDLATALGEVVA
jgi:glycine dehydrogenase subunit 1